MPRKAGCRTQRQCVLFLVCIKVWGLVMVGNYELDGLRWFLNCIIPFWNHLGGGSGGLLFWHFFWPFFFWSWLLVASWVLWLLWLLPTVLAPGGSWWLVPGGSWWLRWLMASVAPGGSWWFLWLLWLLRLLWLLWLLWLLAPVAHLSFIDQSIGEACSPDACCALDTHPSISIYIIYIYISIYVKIYLYLDYLSLSLSLSLFSISISISISTYLSIHLSIYLPI